MKQFSPDFLSTFQTLPNSCVYALISDSTMTCLVSHSNNLQSSIGSLLTSNKVQGNDVRLVILDVLDDKEYKLLLCEKYKTQYCKFGYEVINKRNYIKYSVSIQYSKKLDAAIVVLYNKRRDKKIVGVFKNINAAREFVDQYYKQDVILPVYATNKATKEMEERKEDSKNGRNLT